MEQVCEVCQYSLQGPILDLGKHPLCDDLVEFGNEIEVPKYRQLIQLCSRCLTAHQLMPVRKEELFKPNYHYRAGLTKDVLSGMRDLVVKVIEISNNSNPTIVLDVGCNDGSLLGIFKELLPDSITIGVDPTDAIRESENKIDYAYQAFFDEDIATKILNEHGTPDIICFTNVFAHIENFPALLKSLKLLLGATTVLTIENHYLGAILELNQFDTFYHEHPRTYSATSFSYIAYNLGLEIDSIEFPSRYGGNIRVIMSPTKLPTHGSRVNLDIDEEGFIERFAALQMTFDTWKIESARVLKSMSIKGTFYGKSLPGRAVMLISSLELESKAMPGIFEQSKSPKVGFLVPGTSIEILSDEDLLNIKPDRIVVWAWHIIEEVCSYLTELGYHGEVWVPLPEFKIYKTL